MSSAWTAGWKMEQEELELIQRLQNTQWIQKDAYEDLEEALAKRFIAEMKN